MTNRENRRREARKRKPKISHRIDLGDRAGRTLAAELVLAAGNAELQAARISALWDRDDLSDTEAASAANVALLHLAGPYLSALLDHCEPEVAEALQAFAQDVVDVETMFNRIEETNS